MKPESLIEKILLYGMIAGTFISTSCDNGGVRKIEKKLNSMQQYINSISSMQPKCEIKNITGGPQLERFYVINDDTAYVRIDGDKPDEKYKNNLK